MVPSVQHLYQELLSVLHTVLHIRMCPPKVLLVQNRLGLDANSFRAKFAGNVTAGQYMFGTKAASIKAEPVLYLKDFGRAHTDVQDCVQNGEKFLVQVLNLATLKFIDYNVAMTFILIIIIIIIIEQREAWH